MQEVEKTFEPMKKSNENKKNCMFTMEKYY